MVTDKDERRGEDGRVDADWLTVQEMQTWLRLLGVVELLPGVLDSQLRRDMGLTHFDYMVLAMLSESPEHTLRMSSLAARTNATLARLSHVVRRLEDRGLVTRETAPDDGRANNARLTDAGLAAIVRAAPGHVATVRRNVFDALTPAQVRALGEAAGAILSKLDPQGRLTDHDRVTGRGV